MQNKIFRQIGILFILAISLLSFYIFYEAKSDYILNLRIKKMCAIILVCYATAYSTVAFQAITNNNILTPSVMGLENLYIFIQTLTIYYFGSSTLSKMTGNYEFYISLIIMMIFGLAVYVMLFERLSGSVNIVILAGIVIGGFFSALSDFMQVLLDPNEFLVLQGKIFASFNTIGYTYLNVSFIIILVIIIISIFLMPKLDVLSLGKNTAISLGINYSILVKSVFILVTVLVSISTVLVGPMTFLGIIVVSITRHYLKSYKHSYKTVVATLIALILVVSAMILMERVFSYDTAVSIIINFVGGIYFVYLVIKENKNNVRN